MLYEMYLKPTFTQHEAYIDAQITAAQANILKFAQDQLTNACNALLKAVGMAPSEGSAQGATPLDTVKSLLGTFGPAIAAANAPVRPAPSTTPSASSVSSYMSDESSS